MNTIDVSAQFVFAMKALWLIVTDVAICLQTWWSLNRGFGDGGNFFGRAIGGGYAEHPVCVFGLGLAVDTVV